MLQLLLQHGCSVNLLNHEGEIPLDTAVIFYRKDIISLLLDHGADVNFFDLDNLGSPETSTTHTNYQLPGRITTTMGLLNYSFREGQTSTFRMEMEIRLSTVSLPCILPPDLLTLRSSYWRMGQICRHRITQDKPRSTSPRIETIKSYKRCLGMQEFCIEILSNDPTERLGYSWDRLMEGDRRQWRSDKCTRFNGIRNLLLQM